MLGTTMLRNRGTRGFTLTDIAGLQFWFRSSSISLADGTVVDTWPGLDASTRAATAAGALRPTFKTAILAGWPVVRFTNAHRMATAAITSLPQPRTVFVVGKITAAVTVNQYLVDGLVLNSSVVHCTSSTFRLFAGTALTGPAADNNFHIFAAVFNGASSNIRVGGGAGTTGNAGAAAITGLTLGASASGTAPLTGDIAEVAVYDTALSLANLDKVGRRLAGRYALAWTAAA